MKIVCAGRNYVEHAKELGHGAPKEPLIFLKPPSSVIGDGAPIILPPASDHVEYEGEIGIVIGRRLRRADAAESLLAVRGVVALNDVTARDLQKSDIQWTRAKGFDTFCPIGPEGRPKGPLADLVVVTRVNGKERQRGRANEMLFAISTLLAYITSVMTLDPGDVVATGTPAGVGRLTPGDTVEVEVVGVSRVSNPVVAGV